jgi:hypothetical protein
MAVRNLAFALETFTGDVFGSEKIEGASGLTLRLLAIVLRECWHCILTRRLGDYSADAQFSMYILARLIESRDNTTNSRVSTEARHYITRIYLPTKEEPILR